MKSAAKAAGSKLKAGAKAGAAVKKGVKAAGKSAAANAGKAVGTFQQTASKQSVLNFLDDARRKKHLSLLMMTVQVVS